MICNSGMHFCENPFDVLDYYPLIAEDGTPNEFAQVEALADVHTDDNKKYCTTKLKVGAKLTVSNFIKACVDFVIEKTRLESDECTNVNSGNYAQIGSSGDSAQIDCAGQDSVICCAGNNSAVKAKQGCWITLAEWEYSKEKQRFVPVCVKTAQVDGETIKADVWYRLKNGEFVEVE